MEEIELRAAIAEMGMQNAEAKINFGAMVANPSVVMDLMSSDFWTTLAISSLRQEALAKIEDGSLIPVNGKALINITQAHSIFHIFLQGEDLTVLPTYISFPRKVMFLSLPGVTLLENSDYQAPVIPHIYVKKQSFDQQNRPSTHGGMGVTIVRAEGDQAHEHLPRYPGEFLQPFILPPAEKNGTAFVRDVRVFVINGKPVAGLVRRAQRPLFLQNIRGEVVPGIDQIYSARLRGPKETLDEPLRSIAFAKAQRIHEILVKRFGATKEPYSPYSPAGFLSFDFLIDANHELLPVDCDIQPMVDTFQGTDIFVGKTLAQFLVELAENTGEKKQVVVNGILDNKYVATVYEEVKRVIGESRTVFVESLASQALREFTEQLNAQGKKD